MEHTEKKATTPESPSTHKRIMARNRMRRYRLRQKQNQQARNQAGTMIFTLPPQSPGVYSEVMQGHNVPPPPSMYQSALMEGYEPPSVAPIGSHMALQTTPPQMHSMTYHSHQLQPPPPSHVNMVLPPHQHAASAAHAMSMHRNSSSPPPPIHQGLMPPMPMMPTPQRRESDVAIRGLQDSIESVSVAVSRPVNSVVVVQDIIKALPMRSDSAEAIEFATRVCKILGIHLS